jgi:ADP-ribose pyrophosphatase
MRDAVYFPHGVPGTYDRLIWKNEFRGDVPGVAILPILPSGKIVLNVNYRHATRSWELELPRGKLFSGEAFEEAAVRELKEETGLIASSVLFLGSVAPDSGVLSCIVPVYLGKVSSREESSPEYSEAIFDVLAFTMEELQRGLVQGFLEVPLQGQKKKVPLRDPFLTFALLQVQLRCLIP